MQNSNASSPVSRARWLMFQSIGLLTALFVFVIADQLVTSDRLSRMEFGFGRSIAVLSVGISIWIAIGPFELHQRCILGYGTYFFGNCALQFAYDGTQLYFGISMFVFIVTHITVFVVFHLLRIELKLVNPLEKSPTKPIQVTLSQLFISLSIVAVISTMIRYSSSDYRQVICQFAIQIAIVTVVTLASLLDRVALFVRVSPAILVGALVCLVPVERELLIATMEQAIGVLLQVLITRAFGYRLIPKPIRPQCS